MSQKLTIIDPATANERPPPRRAALVFGVATAVAGVSADLLPTVTSLSGSVSVVSGFVLLAWFEHWIYRRLLRRRPLSRLLLSALVPAIGLFLWVPALIGAAMLGSFLLPLMATAIAGGLWFASAAAGSFVVVLIDTVVSALVVDFRRRVQLAVLLLATSAAVVSAVTFSLVEATIEAVLAVAHGEARAGVNLDPELAQRLVSMDPEQATWAIAGVMLLVVAIFLLPAILSACGKLADAVMERLNPLDEAFSRVTEGDLDIEVEVGGSRELQRITSGFNRMVGSLRETLTSLDQRNRELTATNQATSRFVPFTFLELLDKRSIVEIARGDQVQLDVAVMFTDIRGFTTLAEAMGPEKTFAFINRYLERMEPTIAARGGVINEFLGDGIMAIFPRGAASAVEAAVAMAEALSSFNVDLVAEGREPIRVGIGVQSGALMLGTIGGRDRLSCTVIGDPANAAARVEGMTKLYRVQTLIAEGAFAQLPDGAFELREIDRVQALGKHEAMRIYEVLDGLPAATRGARRQHRAAFERALGLYRRGAFRAAAKAFEAIAEADPTDGPAAVYAERCVGLFDREGAPDWDGVSQLGSK